jgi:hypothetical protein
MWLGLSQDFKLIESVYDFIFDYLRNEFIKRLGLPLRIVSAINTVANLNGWTLLQMLLAKYGYAKFMSWLFWVSLVL